MFQDLRFALRQLRKAPGFTAITVLTLALGIGANTAIFSVLQSVLLSPLPFPDSERIMQVWHSPVPGAQNPADGGTFLDWREHTSSFSAFAALHTSEFNLSGIAEPAQISGFDVTAEYLRVLGISPVLGRDFTAEEDSAGGDNFVAIVTHELWQRRLGGDPAIVGQPLRLNNRTYTVVGVLAPGALNQPNVEVLIPAALGAESWKQQRNYNFVCFVLGRLKPGVTAAQAQAELAAAATTLDSLYPPNKAGWTVTVQSLHSSVTTGARPYLVMLMATVALVLLIACANVANLLLARAATRQTEIAVRIALGASAARIVRLLLAESVVLALLGGFAGLLLAWFALDPLSALVAANGAPPLPITINPTILLFTLGLSLLTGLLFGLAPALRVARPDLNNDLKESARGAVGGSRHRLQRLFIVAETALTVVLLFTAGLLLHSFMATLSADAGLQRDNVLLFDLTLSSNAAPTPAHRVRFVESLVRELEARPGVISAGMISSGPYNNRRFYGDTIRRSENPDPRSDIGTGFDGVGGALFQTLGTPLLRGRFLTAADSAESAPRVLLVNNALARQLFPAVDPLGRLVHFKDADWEVVGLVGDIRDIQLDAPPRPMVYLPTLHFPWSLSFAVRTHGSPRTAAEAVRQAVRAVDTDQPIANLRTIRQAIENSASLRTRRTMLTLVGLFAGIALLLACVGLYGVMAYSVTQRTREIGVRIALGAGASRVLHEILRGGLRLVLTGILLGSLGSIVARIGVANQLYGTALAAGGLVFLVVAVALLLVAALACFIPARRATRVDPMVALRAE